MLTKKDLEEAARNVVNNFGKPTEMFIPEKQWLALATMDIIRTLKRLGLVN